MIGLAKKNLLVSQKVLVKTTKVKEKNNSF